MSAHELTLHGWQAVGELLVRHKAAINPMLRAKQDDNELVNAFDSIFAARDAMSRCAPVMHDQHC